MVYKNYLTTPAGRYCEISDICNGDYLVLIKYIQGENYSAFFKCLTEIVKRDLPDFDEFDVVEKCYVFMAYCMYSIRGSIVVNNKLIGDQEIPISTILNNIEISYVRDRVEHYKLFDNYELDFGFPKSFTFDDGMPVIDYYSGLIGFNKQELDAKNKNDLKVKLDTKTLTFIDDFLREKFFNECDIFNGVPMNSLKINIVGESLIANVIGFYRMSLENFYQVMYVVIKHLRMSYSDFMKISQVETSILMGCAAEENKKMEESTKGGNITTIGRALNDLE